MNFSSLINKIKEGEWQMLLAILFLCFSGLITLYSLNLSNKSNHFFKQFIFFGISLLVMFFVSQIDYRIFKNHSGALIIVYIVSLVLLALSIYLGKNIRGSRAWLTLGGLNFEPVELAKLILVLILAKYFSLRHIHINQIRHIIVSALYMALPLGLVLLQPDLGSGLVLISIWLGMVLISGMKMKQLIGVLLLACIVIALSWSFALHDYQRQRILSFINPKQDPQGAGYNRLQSEIAVGSGNLFGKGLGHGTQSRLNFLPEKETDFIFATYSEEWGFFGIILILGCYLYLFWRITKVAFMATNNFARLTASGIFIMLFTGFFINVGMNIGIMPITGLALPFVSYGGSGLLLNFIAIGILQSITLRASDNFDSKNELFA